MHWYSALLFLAFLSAAKQADGDWCSDAECARSSGWQFLSACKGRVSRNVHYWRYTHESLTLPALAVLGSRARDALVVGGAEGGVANLLVHSHDVQSVTWVSNLTKVTRVALKCMPSLTRLRDERLHRVEDVSSIAIAEAAAEGAKTFDLIIYDALALQAEERPTKTDFFDVSLVQNLRKLLSPHGLLVASAGFLRRPRRLQDSYTTLRQSFETVWTLQFSAPDQGPEQGHVVAFMAGAGDMASPNLTWFGYQHFDTCFYTPELHQALLTPSRTLSEILGLQVPAEPNLAAANSLDRTRSIARVPERSCTFKFTAPQQQLAEKQTKYQKLRVAKEPETGCTALYLDEELQLTNVFGDFYHESLVHPAMAALGPRGRRILVIGAGDGGVATALLRYPQVEKVVQVEIDSAVPEVAKEFLPEIAAGYEDPRHELVIMDGVVWAETMRVRSDMRASFDLCIIDSTDDPLGSRWSEKFYQHLKELLKPYGAVVQNVGSQMDELEDFRKLQKGFRSRHVINCNTPDYPSPYFAAFLTEQLDPHEVDWAWWSSLNISTIYYHPTVHSAMLSVPRETAEFYLEGKPWQPHDAALSKQMLAEARSERVRARRAKAKEKEEL